MTRRRFPRPWHFPVVVLLVMVEAIGSCGGGGDATAPSDNPSTPPGDDVSAVASVEVTPAALDLTVGESTRLAVTLKAADGTVLTGRAVTWSTSDTAVATVTNDGAVSAVAAGKTTITATSEGKTGSTKVTVAPPTGHLRAWIGGASGRPSDWSTAGNWDPAGVPTALDTARVTAAANPAVLSEDVRIARLIVAGGTLRNAGHVLTIKQP